MINILKNQIVFLSISFILLLAAFPLVSIGMTTGPRFLWWLGLIALTIGGLIPPLQRILMGAKKTTAPSPKANDINSKQTKK